MRAPLLRSVVLALGLVVVGAPCLPAGERYAFLVGVADYDKKELKPLQYTRSDILELHQVLVDAGYGKGNIVLMHDDLKQLSNRRFFPESTKIRDELKLLLSGLDKDDSLIVAFSGHGVQFKGQKQNYFCPADARLDDRNTLIALSELYTALEKCPARQKLLLVDACRDDPQSQLGKSRQTVDLESVTRPQTESVPEGLVALFSCAAGERSFEDPDLKHGVFFYHVLEGLKGGARNTDEEVTLDDLVSFTRKKTQTFARTSLAVVQTPQQLGDFTGTWVLRSLKAATTKPLPPVSKPPQSTPPSTPVKGGVLAVGTKAGEEWDGNDLKMKFCWCPDGTFRMGSPDHETGRKPDETQVSVTLTGFWLGKFEITQAEWKSVMGRTLTEQRTTKTAEKVFSVEGPRHPIYYVDHDEATEFCTKLTQRERGAGRLPEGWEYRLPTEAQWEYACRAGTTTRFVCGDDEKQLEEYAWFSVPFDGTTHEVGTKKANLWGLCDMHGNMAEWCRDWHVTRLRGGLNPEYTEASKVHVFRGGSWNLRGEFCRSASRGSVNPKYKDDFLYQGFRVAAVPPPGTPIKAGTPAIGNPAIGTSAGEKPNSGASEPSGHAASLAVGTKAGQEWDGNGLKMKFCWCPDGQFGMGTDDGGSTSSATQDRVSVTLNGFWIGKYEVTQAEWESVMGTTIAEQRTKAYATSPGGDGPNYPMYYLYHDEAMEFARKFTLQERAAGRLPQGWEWEYRLPTEAQWEYACRAGTKTPFLSGKDLVGMETYAWFGRNAGNSANEVGTKRPNAWGLHDVQGNVSEWCRDWHLDALPGGRNPEVLAQGQYAFRVVRGGSWTKDVEYGGSYFRTTSREYALPEYKREIDRGFRLALVRTQPPAPEIDASPAGSTQATQPAPASEARIAAACIGGLVGLCFLIWVVVWRRWRVLIVCLVGAMLVAGAIYGIQHALVANRATRSQNTLRQIGLAVNNYETLHRVLPLNGTLATDGRGLHSWQTRLLPHVEAADLFNRVDFNAAWNEPANAGPMSTVVPAYLSPHHSENSGRGFGLSHYAGNLHVFPRNAGLTIADVSDGMSNTIMAGEAAGNFAAWGDPANLRDPATGINTGPTSFGGVGGRGPSMLFLDGHVTELNPRTAPSVLKALSTPNGREHVDPY